MKLKKILHNFTIFKRGENMVFIPLLLILSLTTPFSLHAMSWLGYWQDADYQKHIAFAVAYFTNQFKLQEDAEQKESTLTYSPYSFVIYKWSLTQAQTAFNTILTNKYASLPAQIKQGVIQAKKNEIALQSGAHESKLPQINCDLSTLSRSEMYNLFCSYLQWQMIDDKKDTRPYKEAPIQNRIDLGTALRNKDIELLRKVLKQPITIDRDINDSLQVYIEEEGERIFKAYQAGLCSIS